MLCNYQDQFTGLVIEFHDVDLHLDTIYSFISKFKLEVIQTYINNYGWITKGKVSTSVEMTFTSYKLEAVYAIVLHPDDMPNNKEKT